MHLRRVASFILGAWIIGSAFMGYIAVQNAMMAERVMSAPPPEVNKAIQVLGFDKVRTLLRYENAEQNRFYFEAWERAQLALGPLLMLLLVFATRVNRLAIALGGAMLVFVVFAHFVLTPEIDYVGRGLDFAEGWSRNNRRMWALRGTYTGLEILKVGIGCVLAGYLFVFKSHRLRSGAHETAPIGDTEHART